VSGIGGSGEYCGNNDAHLGRINVLYHEAFGSICDAGHLVNHTRGRKRARGHYKRAEHQFL
jgi:hypothetical protein